MSFSEKEVDFRVLFEAAPSLCLVLSPDLTIVAASDAYTNATLTKREEIVGRNLFEIFPNNPDEPTVDGVSVLRASFNFVLAHKVPHTVGIQKYDIRREDETFEERYWSPVNKPVLNAKNEVIYIINRVEDVTEFVRLKKEQEVKDKITDDLRILTLEKDIEIFKRSQEIQKLNDELELKVAERTANLVSINKVISDYKFALDESCIVVETDENGIIQHANDNFCNISKYSRDELIGQDHRLVNSGYHSKDFMKNLWETIQSGHIWRGEIKNKAKDETTYWVDTTIVPFLGDLGKPYKYLSIRSDITERKLAYEELKTSEQNYRNLFNNSLVALYSTDMARNKILAVNDVGVQIFGYKSQQDFSENYDPSEHYINMHQRAENISTLREKGELGNWVQEMKKLDGTRFWVNMFVKMNDERTLAQTVLIDITKQIHLQEELESEVKTRTVELSDSLERERALNQMKSRFVSIASHEFRTPLTSILTSASLINNYKDPENEEKRTRHVDRISLSVKNLSDIIDNFLSIEQLEKGIFETNTDLLNLPDLIKNVIDEMESVINNKAQKILYEHEGDEMIKQSKKIIRSVLLNLLSNASKYSPESETIEITSSISNDTVLITIQDHGIGIPLKDQTNLFGDFYRASNVEHIQGTGLGLSIVKKYVALLQGSIHFVSEPQKGTTFSIQFPREIAVLKEY